MDHNDRRILGTLLVDLDKMINVLDRAVFEAAYFPGVGNLDAQRDHAMSTAFQPEVKQRRDSTLEQRNVLARTLGFGGRGVHDWSSRDYVQHTDGTLVPRGAL